MIFRRGFFVFMSRDDSGCVYHGWFEGAFSKSFITNIRGKQNESINNFFRSDECAHLQFESATNLYMIRFKSQIIDEQIWKLLKLETTVKSR